MQVERTFTVPRPVEVVFDYLADFTHTEEWDPGTVRTRRTSGDGGLGTTYANTSQCMGRTSDLTYETTTLERPNRLEFRGHNDSVDTVDSMTFRAVGDVTEVHYRADFHFGRILSLIAPLVVRPKLEKLADDTVVQMRRAIDRI
jgi:carbon monoxide dehydrogenase subunit G